MKTIDEHSHAIPGPAASKIAFENDAVRVLRIRLGPHEKVPMHEVTPRLVIFLTNEHLRLTYPDGRVTEESHKPGDTIWLPAQRHEGENLNAEPLEFVAVLLKDR